MTKAAVTRLWEWRKARAFPAGAVTFHLGAWPRGELSGREGAAARTLMEEHGFRRLLVLHGTAVRVGRETVVLVGPSGVGKSTACRSLVRSRQAILVEDGLVLAGESGERWVLVETGTLDVLRRAAVVSAFLRRCLPRRKDPGGPGAEGRSSGIRRLLDGVAFRGGVLFAPRQDSDFARRLLPIDRVVVADHPDRSLPSYETDGRTMKVLSDVGVSAPPGMLVRRPPATGPRPEVLRGLREALLH